MTKILTLADVLLVKKEVTTVSLSDFAPCFYSRMSMRLVVSALITFSMPLATFGCIQPSQTEHAFNPSPSGTFVASLLSSSTDIQIPPEGITLSESARFRLRGRDGTVLTTFALEVVANSLSPRGRQIVWSKDEKYVACRVLGAVWIIDVAANSKRRVGAEGIIALRWQDDSTLVFVRNNSRQSGARSRQIVESLSLPSHEITLLVDVEASLPSLGLISNYCNQLSPLAEYFIHYDKNVLSVTSLKEGTTIAKFPIGHEPDYWWWNEGSNACLLSTGSMDRVWFYDRQQDSLKEITAQLKNITGVELQTPHPPVVGRVWGPDGTWYLVTGIGKRKYGDRTEPRFAAKDWIYHVKEGSAICVQNEIGDDFWNPSLSPTGEFLAL